MPRLADTTVRLLGQDPLAGRLPTADQLLIAETNEEFAERIVRLLADHDLRVRLGKRARSWARENLTWGASVEGHERLYGRLLGERRLAVPARPAGPEARRPQPQLGHPFGEGSVGA